MKDPIFNANPKLQEYFKTSDGNAFFNEGDAKNHAITLKVRKVEKVERTISKEKPVSPPQTGKSSNSEKGKKLTSMQKAVLRIEAIEKLETVADVESALKDEKAKTVLAAGEKRIKEIQAAEVVIEKTDVENATPEELDLFVKDNAIDLQGKTELEDIKQIVKAYIENPNKEIVPFKGDLN